jgi:hypothetical protein
MWLNIVTLAWGPQPNLGYEIKNESQRNLWHEKAPNLGHP